MDEYNREDNHTNDDMDLDLLVNKTKAVEDSPKFEKKILKEKRIDDDEEVKFNFRVNDDEDEDDEDDGGDGDFGFKPKVVSENSLEKQDLLFKLKRLEGRGIPLSQHYTTSSSLQELKDEYARLKKQRDLDASIKFQRKALVATTGAIEWGNKKFSPFNILLDGWSSSVNDNISDYDEVFEELDAKYSGSGSMSPELKLLLMVGGSAAMFHMSNKLVANAAPDVSEIMKRNPDLAKSFSEAALKEETEKVIQDMPLNIPIPTPSTAVEEEHVDVDAILDSINNDSPPPQISVNVPTPPKKKRGRPKKSKPSSGLVL